MARVREREREREMSEKAEGVLSHLVKRERRCGDVTGHVPHCVCGTSDAWSGKQDTEVVPVFDSQMKVLG